MATVADDLHAIDVQVQRHIYYSQGPGRYHPDESGYADCSGLVCYGYRTAGEGIGDANSWQIATLAHTKGLGISIEQARTTPGALLFVGANEGQTNWNNVGHVASSVGDGRTVEARSHVMGVGYWPWNSSRWDWACKPIGLRPSPTPPPAPPITPRKVANVAFSSMIPGSHAQTKDPWNGRKPIVSVVVNADGTTDLVGMNGASIPGATNAYGVSVFHLGRLNGPVVSIQPEQDAHGEFTGYVVALAEDGGTFGVKPTVNYL